MINEQLNRLKGLVYIFNILRAKVTIYKLIVYTLTNVLIQITKMNIVFYLTYLKRLQSVNLMGKL